MESVHLIGAETVSSAARTMSGAASEMNTAAYNIECALQRQRDFLDDWLQRFTTALNDHAARVAQPLITIQDPAPIFEPQAEMTPEPPPADKRRYLERRILVLPIPEDRRRGTIRRIDDEIPF